MTSHSDQFERKWWKVAEQISEGARIHPCVEGRYITVLKHQSQLSALDSTCYHAAGPLGLGKVSDIEELGISVIRCPWHDYMISLTDGTRAYQAIDIIDSKPTIRGWVKSNKMVQRRHEVYEDNDGVYVCLNAEDVECSSDKNSCNSKCVNISHYKYDFEVSLKK